MIVLPAPVGRAFLRACARAGREVSGRRRGPAIELDLPIKLPTPPTDPAAYIEALCIVAGIEKEFLISPSTSSGRAAVPLASTSSAPMAVMDGREALATAAAAAGVRACAVASDADEELARRLAERLAAAGGAWVELDDEGSAAQAALGASLAGVRALAVGRGRGFDVFAEASFEAGRAAAPLVAVALARDGTSPRAAELFDLIADAFDRAERTGRAEALTIAASTLERIEVFREPDWDRPFRRRAATEAFEPEPIEARLPLAPEAFAGSAAPAAWASALALFREAASSLGLRPEELFASTDVPGLAAAFACGGFEGGRPLAAALGAKLAAPRRLAAVFLSRLRPSDAAALSEAARRGLELAVVCAPGGVPASAAALAFGATFVARARPAHAAHAVHVLGRALRHRGLAVVELDPAGGPGRRLEEAGHDATHREAALARAAEEEAYGVFFAQERERPRAVDPGRAGLAVTAGLRRDWSGIL